MSPVISSDAPPSSANIQQLVPNLVAHARSYVQSDDLAEDVVQDVLVRQWQRGRLPSQPVRGLFHLVGRQSLQSLRSTRRRHDHENLFCTGAPCTCPDPEEAAMLHEIERLLQTALAALPDRLRGPLLLHVVEGLGYQECADRLGIPIGTVRSRLNRARSRLQASAQGRKLWSALSPK